MATARMPGQACCWRELMATGQWTSSVHRQYYTTYNVYYVNWSLPVPGRSAAMSAFPRRSRPIDALRAASAERRIRPLGSRQRPSQSCSGRLWPQLARPWRRPFPRTAPKTVAGPRHPIVVVRGRRTCVGWRRALDPGWAAVRGRAATDKPRQGRLVAESNDTRALGPAPRLSRRSGTNERARPKGCRSPFGRGSWTLGRSEHECRGLAPPRGTIRPASTPPSRHS